MECAVIVTYRCNARCMMCNTWRHPSLTEEEISPEVIDRIQGTYKRLNITGGEPLLREDILDIVDVLNRKTCRLEISTNGYFTERILMVAERFPNITFRVSVDGLPAAHDRIRGLKHAFDHALRTIIELKQMGIRDIGFGITISDRNAADLLNLYHLCAGLDIELANCVMHNSFYFHKHDNKVEDFELVREKMRRFIEALLQSRRGNLRMKVKDWFRAYINSGLLNHMMGKRRSLPCGAATDTFFLDPFGNVLACNGSDESWNMGNLKDASFEEIWRSEKAGEVRRLVGNCTKNCWMTGTAVPAMRKQPWVPISWVLRNKLRLAFGKEVCI